MEPGEITSSQSLNRFSNLCEVVFIVANDEHGQSSGLAGDEGVHAGMLLCLHPGLGPLERDSFDGEELFSLDGLKVDVDALAPQRAFYLALVDEAFKWSSDQYFIGEVLT